MDFQPFPDAVLAPLAVPTPASLPPASVANNEIAAVSPSEHSFMAPPSSDSMLSGDLFSAVKSSEHQVILAALQASDNRLDAAKKLGISPRTLRYKLAQLRERGMELSFAD
jgi:two-component system response regulator FlrC